MFGKTFRLFSVLGIQIQADLSWLIVLVLITWSLAAGMFPAQYEGLSPTVCWLMGFVTAIGLFASIILHELAHSIVAIKCGIPVRRITLFIFGGVAEMEEEPATPRSEFAVAIAGPIMSVLIATVCLAIGAAEGLLPREVAGVFWFLGMINAIVVVFNLIPGLPLDGGRVLRAVMWHYHGDLLWATKFTASMGSTFGTFLVFLGVISFITGNFIGGLWQFLIGLFLRNAAVMSYRHQLIKSALRGATVAGFMKTEVITVSTETTIEQLVEDYVYSVHHKLYPVMDADQLLGCVTTREIKQVPRANWSSTTVGDILIPCSDDTSITSKTDAAAALTRMSQQKNSRLMVVDEERLVGVITLKDLMDFILLKFELEESQLG